MADVMQTGVSGEQRRCCLVLIQIDLMSYNKTVNWTSLFFACKKGYTNIARILLEHHADPHRCNKNGHSPFTVAQQEDFKEILDIIEQHSSHEIP
jgi:L-cysteine desulfidase